MQALWFLKSINKYIAGYKWLAILLVGCLIFDAAFDSAMRASLKFLIDAAIVPKNYSLLILIISLMVVGAILYGCIGLLGNFLGARLGILIINNIRISIFEHLQNLSMDFFGRRSAGDIVKCLISDTNRVESGLVTMGLSVLIIDFSGILFSVSILFFLNWQLAILSCIGLTFCIIAPTKIAQIATENSYELMDKEGEIASIAEENILSQSVVKIFGLEKQVTKRFSVHLNDLKRVYVPAMFVSYLVQKIPIVVFVLLQVVILSVGAAMTYWNLITVGTLVSYQVFLLGLHLNILGLTAMLPEFIAAVAALRRISDILSEIPQIQDAPNAVDLPHFESEIRFENATFSYSEERRGINNLSLNIRKGDFAVFVGSSGAGKSTIVNLLTRFYDLDKGQILFDKVDLRDCTQQSLRSQIGLVSQDVILFNDSVGENIRMGYLEATTEQIEAAAKAAEIHDFILSLPQGYDTPVGNRGGQLSGGQRQRIALARALVRNPAILILDEATSALDPITEAGILATLSRIASECTVIIITHRISQALRADVIFVMENGRIVESGSHVDLIQLGGLYATMRQQSHRANNDVVELVRS